MGRYVESSEFDPDTIAAAESMFDYLIGRVLSVTAYEERIKIKDQIGRLTHTPVVKLVSIKAACNDHGFGAQLGTIGTTIPPNEVMERDGHVILPLTFFRTSYDAATVSYEAGYQVIPADVSSVVLEIARLQRSGVLDAWGGAHMLSADSQDTIARYRGGV